MITYSYGCNKSVTRIARKIPRYFLFELTNDNGMLHLLQNVTGMITGWFGGVADDHREALQRKTHGNIRTDRQRELAGNSFHADICYTQT